MESSRPKEKRKTKEHITPRNRHEKDEQELDGIRKGGSGQSGETSTATKKDGYTQVPRPSVFIHGLRGCGAIGSAPNATNVVNNQANWTTLYRETTATTVDLTIPVEQQLLGDLQKVTVGHNL
ncbi:unnamed protein product [Schistosoma margrebowiei]|uniref:Uncharacterized protein n=1 Tax=Schistosoma margrebowiei TaxID=48269 RepID=A0A183M906_9TREM|nr:unnamed protein product [Schistosoma margrebowiei]